MVKKKEKSKIRLGTWLIAVIFVLHIVLRQEYIAGAIWALVFQMSWQHDERKQ